ncbi:MAG TPA: DUF3618 domain-containing protein [Candidatus Limnocylindria bacterium]|nr:DUF3618 domain-containing protein [Candidatus Limnocylindria bacterium]
MTTERNDGPTDMTDEDVEMAAIRSDIEETRVEMGGTLHELGERLEPGNLVHQAKENVRDATIGRVEETAKGMSDMVMDTIRSNPIPAAMAGAGLAMLWMNRSNGTRTGTGHRPGYAAGSGYGYRAGDGRQQDRGIADRAGEAMSNVGDTVGQTVGQVGETVGQTAGQVSETVGQTVQVTGWRIERFMQSSPLAVGAIAVGAGALVGALIPETPPERQMLGDASRAVGETVRDTVGQATDRAEEALDKVESEQSGRAGG